jgi:hypothetical protein
LGIRNDSKALNLASGILTGLRLEDGARNEMRRDGQGFKVSFPEERRRFFKDKDDESNTTFQRAAKKVVTFPVKEENHSTLEKDKPMPRRTTDKSPG